MPESNEFIAQRVEPVKETPVSPVESKRITEGTVITPELLDKPPSLEKQPYLIKMLELGFSKDHFQMPSLISDCNNFVLNEIKRNNLKDDPDTYKEIVNKYLKKMPEDLDDYAKIERLQELMMIDRKLIEAMLEKKRIDSKPIEELTSSQLKARIEGK